MFIFFELLLFFPLILHILYNLLKKNRFPLKKIKVKYKFFIDLINFYKKEITTLFQIK